MFLLVGGRFKLGGGRRYRMKRGMLIIFLTISLFVIVYSQNISASILSYTNSNEEVGGGLRTTSTKFHANEDISIERFRFNGGDYYGGDDELREINVSITEKNVGSAINKNWDQTFKIPECENGIIEQTLMKVSNKKYLYGPIRFVPLDGWNYVLLESPIKISAGKDFYVEFSDSQNMISSKEQTLENTFVSVMINNEEYIGLPRESYCLSGSDFSFKDEKLNLQVEINPVETSKYKCNETDLGKNYNIGGWVSLYTDGMGGRTDPDSCSGINILSESYCLNETSTEASIENYACPGVCLEMACAIPTVCPAKINLKLDKNKVLSIKTYDTNNNLIESVINYHRYIDGSFIESRAMKIPNGKVDFETEELIKDIGRLEKGSYLLIFNTSVENCKVQEKINFEIRDNESALKRFMNFLKSLFD